MITLSTSMFQLLKAYIWMKSSATQTRHNAVWWRSAPMSESEAETRRNRWEGFGAP